MSTMAFATMWRASWKMLVMSLMVVWAVRAVLVLLPRTAAKARRASRNGVHSLANTLLCKSNKRSFLFDCVIRFSSLPERMDP